MALGYYSTTARDAMYYEQMRYEFRHEMERMRRDMQREMHYQMGMNYAFPSGSYIAPVTPAQVTKSDEKKEKLKQIISYYYTQKR
jgi:hypothetical protein